MPDREEQKKEIVRARRKRRKEEFHLKKGVYESVFAGKLCTCVRSPYLESTTASTMRRKAMSTGCAPPHLGRPLKSGSQVVDRPRHATREEFASQNSLLLMLLLLIHTLRAYNYTIHALLYHIIIPTHRRRRVR